MFCILGNQRSGTNFLGSLIRSHPEVSLLIEPFSQHFRFIGEQFCRHWGARDYDVRSYHRSLAMHSEEASWLEAFRDWFYSTPGGIKVFKETVFLMKLQWFNLYLPGVQLIFLSRNPLGIISSFKKSSLFTAWNYQEKYQILKSEVFEHQDLHKYRYIFELIEEKKWVQCLLAMILVRRGELLRHLYHFKHHVLSYEALCQETEKEVARLFDFMKLEFPQSVRNEIGYRCSTLRGGTYSTYRETKNAPFGWVQVLSSQEKWEVEQILIEVDGNGALQQAA